MNLSCFWPFPEYCFSFVQTQDPMFLLFSLFHVILMLLPFWPLILIRQPFHMVLLHCLTPLPPPYPHTHSISKLWKGGTAVACIISSPNSVLFQWSKYNEGYYNSRLDFNNAKKRILSHRIPNSHYSNLFPHWWSLLGLFFALISACLPFLTRDSSNPTMWTTPRFSIIFMYLMSLPRKRQVLKTKQAPK